MVLALGLLALAMVLGGALAIYQGVLILAFSSGGTLVMSGVIVATGGAVLAGLAALLGALRRVEAALARLGAALPDRAGADLPAGEEAGPADLEPLPQPSVPAPRPEARREPPPLAGDLRGTLDESEVPDEPRVPDEPKPPPAPPAIAGTYASGGNTYTMFTDGSVQAETPQGRYRFDTVDDLKAFIAAGGERRA